MSSSVDVHRGPLTMACEHARAEYHVHLEAVPVGAWVSLDTPGMTWGAGYPFGRRPQLVRIVDSWWSRACGRARPFGPRLAEAIAEHVAFVRRRIGEAPTPDELAGLVTSREAIELVLGERDG